MTNARRIAEQIVKEWWDEIYGHSPWPANWELLVPLQNRVAAALDGERSARQRVEVLIENPLSLCLTFPGDCKPIEAEIPCPVHIHACEAVHAALRREEAP